MPFRHPIRLDTTMNLCIVAWRWPGQLIRVIIIVVIAAIAARWDPSAALPLIAGVSLGGWLLASVPGTAVVAR